MIAGIFHQGSGLGNQLHRYVGTRIIAEERGEKHSMIAPGLFKGKHFLNLEMEPNNIKYTIEEPSGRVIPETDIEVLDGEFQKESDFIHYIKDIRKWLSTPPLPNQKSLEGGKICVINFRGGEYVGHPVFLPKNYWLLAIDTILEEGPEIEFEVHTDDPITARQFFPNHPIVSDMEINWRSIRHAKYLILSNSSFAILPALMNENAIIIAPQYWSGYNTGVWPKEENKYERFTYIHHLSV